MSAQPRQRPDLDRYAQVPEVPALESLSRPPTGGTFKGWWTPTFTLLVIALTPVAFWVYSSGLAGRTALGPALLALTGVLSVGAAFVASSYLRKGALAGGICGISPLVGLFVAGWLIDVNPSLLGVFMATVVVGAGSFQRVTRTSC